MTLSKRLALLGAQSAITLAKPRGLGSSLGLLDRRPFPYRQFSELTKANGRRAFLVDTLALVISFSMLDLDLEIGMNFVVLRTFGISSIWSCFRRKQGMFIVFFGFIFVKGEESWSSRSSIETSWGNNFCYYWGFEW